MNLTYLVYIAIFIFIIGLLGYKALFNTTWVDAFYYTCTTVSTVDIIPEELIITDHQKIFIGLYSLIAALLFITIVWKVVETGIDRSK
jgi:hypothetical protein